MHLNIIVEIFGKIKNQYGKPYVGASGEDGILQRRGGYFYDLGCGTGKPLVAAALLHDFDVCCGIECLEGLFTAAVELVGIYNAKVVILKFYYLIGLQIFNYYFIIVFRGVLRWAGKLTQVLLCRVAKGICV